MSEEDSRTTRSSYDIPLENPPTVVARLVCACPCTGHPIVGFVLCKWRRNSPDRALQHRGLSTKRSSVLCLRSMPRRSRTFFFTRLQDEEPYEKLKHQLIARIADSEHQKLRQLLTAEELGDRKPSQLLRKMLLLLGDKAKMIDSSLLRELFLQRLPTNMQMILASADSMTLDKLAETADRIMDVATPTISSVSQSSEGVDFRKIFRESVAEDLRTQGRSCKPPKF